MRKTRHKTPKCVAAQAVCERRTYVHTNITYIYSYINAINAIETQE